MTRSASTVASHKRASSWLIVVGSFVAYLGLVVALGLAGTFPDVPLPWWAAQVVPPAIYAALVFVVVRPRSALALASGVVLLWVAHMLVGALTLGALAVLSGTYIAGLESTFPPPPLPELFWVSVLLVPLRDVLKGDAIPEPGRPMPAANRRPAIDRRAPGAPAARPAATPAPAVRPPMERPATAPPRPTTAVTSMEPRADVQRRSAPAQAKPSAESAPAGAVSEKAANVAKEAAAAHAQRLLDEL